MRTTPDVPAVEAYLHDLQDRICRTLEREDDGPAFREDAWTSRLGTGRSRLLEGGAVIERAGVMYSHVSATQLPPAATARHPERAGHPFIAMGVSVVVHPRNPFVPTAHMNVRFLQVRPADGPPVWWFGGGFDLTPYYGFDEDCVDWHRAARTACAVQGPDAYARFKAQCDAYFFLKHRGEPRGIGGIFYDDLDAGGFDAAFAFMRAVGDGFIAAYQPIVARRKDTPYTEAQRDWQLYRRGRYVEFNLVWDRGTHFGLQSGGRSESILTSMPPLVRWEYDHHPRPGSPEARLLTRYLVPFDWAQGAPPESDR